MTFMETHMTLDPNTKYPSRRTYILNLRSDAQPGALAGRLENVITGHQHEFSNEDELLDQLADDVVASDEHAICE